MKIAAAKRNKKGFTLVELVIVIAVLAVLAAIAVPTVTNVITQANTNTDASNCQTIELALKSAAAEATAGTWDIKSDCGSSATPDNITVAQALKHEGLDLTTLQNGIKSNSGKKFYYVLTAAGSGLGHIYVVDDGDNRNELASGTIVSNYLAGN